MTSDIRATAKLRLYESTPAEARRVDGEAARPAREADRAVYEAFARSIQADPLERIFSQGDVYITGERWGDVQRAADRAQAIDPASAVGPYLQAHAHYAAGRWSDALTSCTRAIDLEPDWAELYWGRQSIYEQLGDDTAAARDRTRAIELDPSLAEEVVDDEAG